MAVERKHPWRNQSHFLQITHAADHDTAPSPETIAVNLPHGPQGFDLLCWTINVAARPGDSVIALRPQLHDASQEGMDGGVARKSEVLEDAQFKPLQGLCDMKEVNLEVRICSRCGNEERCLVDEVVSMEATMLVVTISGHPLQRCAQRKGRYLCKNLAAGCSVVVVRDYKVLFYKENRHQLRSAIARDRGRMLKVEARSLAMADTKRRSRSSSSSSSSEKDGTISCSPIGVLDGPEEGFYETDDDAGDNHHHHHQNEQLLRSLSKKALITDGAISSHGQHEIICFTQQCSCFNIWIKRKPVCCHRSFTFPASAPHLKLLLHCKSLSTSFRSYLTSFFIPKPPSSKSLHASLLLPQKPCTIFSYQQISRATNLFSKVNLIGKGGHSEVYKGFLSTNQLIAVKRLIQAEQGDQKTIDFLTELGLICHTSHPNIIRLVGFCVEKGLYLVFHFLEHGSLASYLHGGRNPTLKWEIRYKVAVGTARGLNYLHSQCSRRIIHRDIKASNILLGPDFEPQISDFGLAKWLPDDRPHHVPMPIEGTFGYLAPEYFMHGVVDEKTDVFAFGVLLLELITGRKPIEGLQSSLVVWARPFFESMNIQGLADVHLRGEYDPQEMQCMMMAAALCVQPLPQCRPSMSQVLQLLSDERSPNGLDAVTSFSSQTLCLQDPIFNEEYNTTHYHNDMLRHREIALQF